SEPPSVLLHANEAHQDLNAGMKSMNACVTGMASTIIRASRVHPPAARLANRPHLIGARRVVLADCETALQVLEALHVPGRVALEVRAVAARSHAVMRMRGRVLLLHAAILRARRPRCGDSLGATRRATDRPLSRTSARPASPCTTARNCG